MTKLTRANIDKVIAPYITKKDGMTVIKKILLDDFVNDISSNHNNCLVEVKIGPLGDEFVEITNFAKTKRTVLLRMAVR